MLHLVYKAQMSSSDESAPFAMNFTPKSETNTHPNQYDATGTWFPAEMHIPNKIWRRYIMLH